MLRTAFSVLAGARAPGKPRGRLLTAAAVAGGFALAACGPVQMGAAALMGSQRVSAATLTAQVSNLQAALKASRGKVQPQFQQGQEPQQVLAWLVRFGVRERMAVRNHVTVTRGESLRALASIAAQARQGGGGVPLAALAAANGLPPDLLGELGRYQAIQNDIVNKLTGGRLPATQAGQQLLGREFNHEQCLAAKSLNIRINPQFGQLDYTQISVVPATVTLSAPEIPSPAPTSKQQLTPPC